MKILYKYINGADEISNKLLFESFIFTSFLIIREKKKRNYSINYWKQVGANMGVGDWRILFHNHRKRQAMNEGRIPQLK